MTSRPKRPRDLNQLAKAIANIATGEGDSAKADMKNSEGQRLGGLRGGAARAKVLSPNRRSEIAKAAAKVRWSKDTDDE